MKKIVYGLMSMIVMMSAYSCSSGHYVSARPETVIVTRPAQPRPNYVWVDGDYYWSGGRYVARPGYWAAPRAGRTWRSGTWAQAKRGYVWHRGGWR